MCIVGQACGVAAAIHELLHIHGLQAIKINTQLKESNKKLEGELAVCRNP